MKKEIKKKVVKKEDPCTYKNFTCGKCRRVVPYRPGFKCIYCDEVK